METTLTALNKKADTIPADAIYVGRPTQWGNPFTLKHSSRIEAVEAYARWILESNARIQAVRQELFGKHLVCWCSPELCHAHVLLIIANSQDRDEAMSELARLFS